MGSMDNRSHERLGVRIRCMIQLPGPIPRTEKAFTVNMSRGGMLLRWVTTLKSEIPKIGDVIQAEIPLRETPHFEQRYLRCAGEVVRVSWEEETGGVLMALRLHTMRLQAQPLHREAVGAV